MKIICLALLAALLTVSTHAADSRPGEVVKVFTRGSKKTTVDARVGDLVVFSVQGGTFPGGFIENLKVEVKGDALSKVGVWFVPNISPEGERAVGGIDCSAFLKAEKPGAATVTITPQGELSKEIGKVLKYTVTVTKPDAPE